MSEKKNKFNYILDFKVGIEDTIEISNISFEQGMIFADSKEQLIKEFTDFVNKHFGE